MESEYSLPCSQKRTLSNCKEESILEKLTVAQLVKELHVFYGTHSLITIQVLSQYFLGVTVETTKFLSAEAVSRPTFEPTTSRI
jgi:hypothetical protein